MLSLLRYEATKRTLVRPRFTSPVTVVSRCFITAAVIGGLYITYRNRIGYYRSDIKLHQTFTEEDYQALSKYKKIMVLGCCSSGKSTLCQNIKKIQPRLAHIEIDSLYWKPNWTEPEEKEFEAKVTTTLDKHKDGWIVDGVYYELNELKDHDIWKEVELVIWLDYDFWVVFWRAVKRTTYQIITNQAICGDNYRDWRDLVYIPVIGGIPGWVWQFHPTYKQRRAQWDMRYTQAKVITMPSPYHCDYWLNKCAQ